MQEELVVCAYRWQCPCLAPGERNSHFISLLLCWDALSCFGSMSTSTLLEIQEILHSPPSYKLTIKYVFWQAYPGVNTASNNLLLFKAVFLWPYIQWYYHLHSFYCCLYIKILQISLLYPFQVWVPIPSVTGNKIMGQGLTYQLTEFFSYLLSRFIAIFLHSTYSLLQKLSLKINSLC